MTGGDVWLVAWLRRAGEGVAARRIGSGTFIACVLAVAAFILPAAAQPRLVPATDVDVLYHLEGAAAQQIPGGAPDGVRLQWDAAGQRLRAEPVGAPVYAITDLRRRVASLVFAAQSSVLELPLRGGDPQTLLAGADARFTRRGAGHVLGMDCTEWSVQARHVDATGCVTAGRRRVAGGGRLERTARQGGGAVRRARADPGRQLRAAAGLHPRSPGDPMRLAIVAILLAAPALAADRPPTIPLRDVDVTYRIAQPVEGGAPLSQRMRWLVATGRLRVDPPSPGLYMIVDYTAKRMSVVKLADRAVLDVPTVAPGLPGAPAGAYAVRDAAVVAGLPCTNWLTTDAAGQDTLLCLTPDGVMLRASQRGQTLLEAVSVSYGPQDPAAFTPPDGFHHVAGAMP